MKFYDEGLDKEELKKEYFLKLNNNTRFKTLEELQFRINEYFDKMFQQHRPYTMSGLALWLGVTTKTLRSWEKDYGDTVYTDIIKFAKQRVENYAEESLYDNRKASGAKFVLENYFDLAEKHNVETSVNVKLEDVLDD